MHLQSSNEENPRYSKLLRNRYLEFKHAKNRKDEQGNIEQDVACRLCNVEGE